jgi:DNA helicase-2/ATP-dependent DNA helicase PcrA
MEYTQEQLAAIKSLATQRIVFAGAGTGKTSTLTGAVNNNNNNKRLVITFTNKAANELKQRVNIDNSVKIGTFHAIAWDLLKDGDYQIIDDHKQKDILKMLFPYYSLKHLKELRQRINLSKCLLLPSWFDRGQYDEYCFENKLIDFGQLIITATETLFESDYNDIYVDEFQDTDPAQLAFVLKIQALGNARIFVVGDPRQAIYGWRGGDIKCFDAIKTLGDCQEFELTVNFRSDNEIVKIANSVTLHKELKPLISKSDYLNQADLESCDDSRKGIVEIFQHPNDTNFVASMCREIIMTGKEETIAVLFRKNATIRLYEYNCIRYCIPYVIWGGMKITDYNIVKDFLAWLVISKNYSDRAAFIRAAQTIKGIGPKLAEKASYGTNTNTNTNTNVKNVLLMNFYSFLDEIKNLDFIQRSIRIVHFLNGKDNLNVHLDEILTMAKKYNNVRDFLNSVLLETNNQQKNKPVILSTIHKVKGLEFDHVFIPACNSENYPIQGGDFTEENNCFYVAVTRAKKALYITSDDDQYSVFLNHYIKNKY